MCTSLLKTRKWAIVKRQNEKVQERPVRPATTNESILNAVRVHQTSWSMQSMRANVEMIKKKWLNLIAN